MMRAHPTRIWLTFTIVLQGAMMLSGCSSTPSSESGNPKTNSTYPETPRIPVTETLFGERFEDPYRWLEDVKSTEVQKWMENQDQFTRAYLAAKPFQTKLIKRFKELYYLETISTPWKLGDRYFYTRRHVDKEKAIVYWRDGQNGTEKVLLDPNKMAPLGRVSLGRWVPSWDGKKVAFARRENAADEATVHVLDVESGVVSDIDVIPGGKYASPDWTPDNRGFYYTNLPVNPQIPVSERPGTAEIRFHKIGDDPGNDPVIYPATKDPKTFLSANLSKDGRWLFVTISRGWQANDLFLKDMSKPTAVFEPIFIGQDAIAYASMWRDRLYIYTNHKAPRFKVMTASAFAPEMKNWQDLIPEAKEAVLDGVQLIGGRLAVSLLTNATSALQIHDLNGTRLRTVPLPGVGSASSLVGQPDDDEAYFSFTSFTTPTRIYRTSVKSGRTSKWAEVKVPADPEPYIVEQKFYPSKDGAKVSMFIIRRKDMPKDGTTPFLMSGYGGFSVSLTPAFSSYMYPWLEAGGGYAIPNLRGGGEYGEDWHRSGMRGNKQNVFDDFIAAGEFLIREKYTSPAKLAIRGGSNGGLLMGAMLTQRPDLFGAVICAVPLLDMIRYHKFGSGQTWVPEYGNPDVENEFRWLKGYSPYQKVKTGVAYPPTLFLSADNDDRVDPMHARKMAAAMQSATSGPGPILLRVQKHAGHGGADQVQEAVREDADEYAFLFTHLKMNADGFRD